MAKEPPRPQPGLWLLKEGSVQLLQRLPGRLLCIRPRPQLPSLPRPCACSLAFGQTPEIALARGSREQHSLTLFPCPSDSFFFKKIKIHRDFWVLLPIQLRPETSLLGLARKEAQKIAQRPAFPPPFPPFLGSPLPRSPCSCDTRVPWLYSLYVAHLRSCAK